MSMAACFVAAGGSVGAYGAATALQHAAAHRVEPRPGQPLALLADLARRPVWALGIACNAVAYGLRIVALHNGPLAVVQPLLVAGVLLAIVLARVITDRSGSRGSLAGAGAVAAGLAVFLVAARPVDGSGSAGGRAWAAVIVGVCALAGLLVGWARESDRRPMLLAGGGGLLLTLAAALAKATLAQGPLSDVLHVATRWEPYALVAVTVLAVMVVQTAYQAGPLETSLPVLSVVEALSGIVLGFIVFGERLANGPAARVGELGGLVLLVGGILAVASAPAAAMI